MHRNEVEEAAQFARIARWLTQVASADALYGDRYFERAEALLRPILSRERYAAIREDSESLPRLANTLREAVERQDWERTLVIAAQADSLRGRMLGQAPLLQVGDAVYGPRPADFTAMTFALNGVVAAHGADLLRARASVVEQLRSLAEEDSEWSAFYERRLRHFESLQLDESEQSGSAVEGPEIRGQVLGAVQSGDFAAVQRLVKSIVRRGADPVARLRVRRPDSGTATRLAAPISVLNEARMQQLGLKQELLPPAKDLNEYLGCCCADRPTLSEAPLTDTHRRAETCTCGHKCPPEVHATLRENLDLLLLHVFITSGGVRYLPWFGRETLLVETVAEDEADGRTDLLEMLRLAKRRGLPRMMIEDALRSRGAAVIREIGLDPDEFMLVCIPFDAYLRLAPSYGWGLAKSWTHFDGYQVCRDHPMRALVGGDARFGGPNDLCSVGRSYDAERVAARFAVVRRERMTIRGEI